MNSFRFTKMHGLGNSYIYVNQFEEHLLRSCCQIWPSKCLPFTPESVQTE